MGKKDAPPPPDYAAAAKAQGDANLQAGSQTAAFNRPNQVDPNGSQSWTMREGADPKNPQPGDWIVTNKLNDTQQALKDKNDAISGQYADLAKSSLTSIGHDIGTKFDPSTLKTQTSGINYDGLRDFTNSPELAQHEKAPQVEQNRAELNTNGLKDFGSVAPTTEASRQRITDALYQRQTAMLDPQTQHQNSDLTSRLASQGITEGSDAYKRAVDTQAQQQANAYAGARNDAILAGGAEDSRITNSNLNVANFDNSTRGQQFDERGKVVTNQNANTDAIFGQGLASAGFNNNANDVSFNQGMSKMSADNGVRAAQLGEKQTIAGFNNTLHQNELSEAVQQRQMGLNEANALRTGNQLGTSQFQAYGGAGPIGAAPVYQATQDGYNAQVAATNAANANNASMWGGLVKLGTAPIM